MWVAKFWQFYTFLASLKWESGIWNAMCLPLCVFVCMYVLALLAPQSFDKLYSYLLSKNASIIGRSRMNIVAHRPVVKHSLYKKRPLLGNARNMHPRVARPEIFNCRTSILNKS